MPLALVKSSSSCGHGGGRFGRRRAGRGRRGGRSAAARGQHAAGDCGAAGSAERAQERTATETFGEVFHGICSFSRDENQEPRTENRRTEEPRTESHMMTPR